MATLLNYKLILFKNLEYLHKMLSVLHQSNFLYEYLHTFEAKSINCTSLLLIDAFQDG